MTAQGKKKRPTVEFPPLGRRRFAAIANCQRDKPVATCDNETRWLRQTTRDNRLTLVSTGLGSTGTFWATLSFRFISQQHSNTAAAKKGCDHQHQQEKKT